MSEIGTPRIIEADDEAPGPGESRAHAGRLAILVAVVLALGWWGGLPLLVVALSIPLMIFLHELGHFLTAKWAGMKVTEFFVGFGPRIWSFRRGETEYGIKALPVGGYARIIGMHNLDEVDPADEPRTYRQKSYWRRMSVAVAGSTMHFLLALILAFVTFVGYGEYTDESERAWTVSELSDPEELAADLENVEVDPQLQALLDAGQTPASAAGLQPGDHVVAAEGTEFETYDDFRAYVRDHPGETVTLTVERGDDTFTTEAALGRLSSGDRAVGFLGIAPDFPPQPLAPVEAAGRSFTMLGELTVESVKGIGVFFSPSGLSDFVGTAFDGDDDPSSGNVVTEEAPSEDSGRVISVVGVTRLGAEATAEEGAVALLRLLVLFNIFVGVINLVPLLPFDGGHVAIATYERIREFGTGGRRYFADVTKLLPVAYATVFLLISVSALALYLDIADPVQLQ
jgi:membrane-associated protease RseP (regulator of RpoE activity)